MEKIYDPDLNCPNCEASLDIRDLRLPNPIDLRLSNRVIMRCSICSHEFLLRIDIRMRTEKFETTTTIPE